MNKSAGKFHTFIEKLQPENRSQYGKELKSYLDRRREDLLKTYGPQTRNFQIDQ